MLCEVVFEGGDQGLVLKHMISARETWPKHGGGRLLKKLMFVIVVYCPCYVGRKLNMSNIVDLARWLI